MGLIVATAPAEEPVSLDEARQFCRIRTDDQNAVIQRNIRTAREWVETFCRRALVSRELQLTLDAWPADGEIELPQAPLVSVEEVRYLDTANAWQTLVANTHYRVLGAGMIDVPGRIVSAVNTSWPSLLAHPEAVEIDFTAGYGTADQVPDTFKEAILVLVSDMFEHREETITGTSVATIQTVKRLLWSKRLLAVADVPARR